MEKAARIGEKFPVGQFLDRFLCVLNPEKVISYLKYRDNSLFNARFKLP